MVECLDMERYLLLYDDGRKPVYEVEDKFHFYQLLTEIDKNFTKIFQWDRVQCIWKEVLN